MARRSRAQVLVRDGSTMSSSSPASPSDGAALLDPAERGDPAAVTRLLDAGVDPGHTNEWGFDPLGAARWGAHLRTANVSVQRHAPVSLDQAAALGRVEAVDAAWPEGLDEPDMVGAHLLACRAGSTTSVRWFLDRGMPVDLHPGGAEWGGIGCPGLHHATVNGCLDVVALLLDAGVAPRASH